LCRLGVAVVVARSRNAALAARIAELGLTERELADRLNDAVGDATGVAGKATDRYVRLLVDGTVRWPWPTRRQALETVLGRPILELGFIPRPKRGHTEPDNRPSRSAAAAPPGPGEPAAVDLVGVADGRPLTIDLPPLPTGQVGFPDLDRLAGPLTQLHDLHGRHGPAGLAPAAARQATRLAGVHNSDMSSHVRAGLYALIGEWWATAAGLAVDAGDEVAAGRYLRHALWQAAIARDPLLDAHVAHVMAARAAQLGEYGEAAAVASTMLRRASGTEAGRWVAVAGHLHAAAANVACGGLPVAQRALDRALDALQAGGEAWRPAPPWLGRLGTWAVDAGRARAALTVGRYDLATEYGGQAVAAVPAGQVWDRVLVLLDLAAACLGQREVEQAADHADVALDLACQLTEPWHCGPVADRLERLAKGFAPWSEVPRAQQRAGRYRPLAMSAAEVARRSAARRRGHDAVWPESLAAAHATAGALPARISGSGAG
jgi:hypothetical protein